MSQSQQLCRDAALWNDVRKPAPQVLGETPLAVSETAATEGTSPILPEEIRNGRAQKLNYKSLRALLTVALQYQTLVCIREMSFE